MKLSLDFENQRLRIAEISTLNFHYAVFLVAKESINQSTVSSVRAQTGCTGNHGQSTGVPKKLVNNEAVNQQESCGKVDPGIK